MSLRVDVEVARGALRIRAAFAADPGETCALVGPNGAGKSTLLAVAAGLVRPDSGRVELDGVVLDDAGPGGVHVPPQARPIGVVFQDLLLFPHLTAVQNAAFPLVARGLPAAEARERAMALLDRLGVLHRADARPGALSGGEAQRVALARALIAAPRLLLLDEPLSALDRPSRMRIRGLLADVLAEYRGVTVLVTHDPHDARFLAKRVVVLEGGVITHNGPVADVLAAPRGAFLTEMLDEHAR